MISIHLVVPLYSQSPLHKDVFTIYEYSFQGNCYLVSDYFVHITCISCTIFFSRNQLHPLVQEARFSEKMNNGRGNIISIAFNIPKNLKVKYTLLLTMQESASVHTYIISDHNPLGGVFTLIPTGHHHTANVKP